MQHQFLFLQLIKDSLMKNIWFGFEFYTDFVKICYSENAKRCENYYSILEFTYKKT